MFNTFWMQLFKVFYSYVCFLVYGTSFKSYCYVIMTLSIHHCLLNRKFVAKKILHWISNLHVQIPILYDQIFYFRFWTRTLSLVTSFCLCRWHYCSTAHPLSAMPVTISLPTTRYGTWTHTPGRPGCRHCLLFSTR